MVKLKYKNIRVNEATHAALRDRRDDDPELKTFDDAIRQALRNSDGAEPRGVSTEIGLCVESGATE